MAPSWSLTPALVGIESMPAMLRADAPKSVREGAGQAAEHRVCSARLVVGYCLKTGGGQAAFDL